MTADGEQSYEQLFLDQRRCVDQCHRDGVIKDRVEEDPERYAEKECGVSVDVQGIC